MTLRANFSLLDHLPNPTWCTKTDGKCIFVNHAWLSFTGRTLEQELDLGWMDNIHPDDRDRFMRDFMQAMNSHQYVKIEYRIKRQNGKYAIIANEGRPVTSQEAGFEGYIGSCSDITEQRSIEAKLKSKESIVGSVIASSSDGIALYDSELRLLKCNTAAAKKIARFFPEGFEGKHVSEFLPPPAAKTRIEAMKRALQERRTILYLDQHEDLTLETCIYPVSDRDNQPLRLVVMTRNRTAEYKAQKDLTESESRIRCFLNNIPDVAWMKNKEGHMVAVNEAYCKFMGLTCDQVLMKTVKDLYPQSVAEALQASEDQALVTKKQQRTELQIKDSNGVYHWIETIRSIIVDENGQIVGTTGVGRDTTERRALLEALEQKTHLIERILNTSPYLIYIFDLKAGRITYINGKSQSMLGYTQEQIKSMDLDALLCIPHSADVSALLANCEKLKDPHFSGLIQFRCRMRHANGEWRVHNIGQIPFNITANGRLESIFFSAEDITKELKNEEEKNKLQLQLAHSSKMAAIGTLAASLAHEVNNPLSLIMAYLYHMEIMLHESTSPEIKGCLELCEKQKIASSRIEAIVKGLGRFARMDTDRIELVDLNHVITDAIGLISNIYRKCGIQIETQLDQSIPLVRANIGKLHQVFLNLFTNARDALEGTKEHKQIRVKTISAPGRVIAIISDTGCGIRQEHLERIFEPFFTTKESGKGTGLGLSITYGIIEEFNGQIEVASSPGQGSKFSVILPANTKSIQS